MPLSIRARCTVSVSSGSILSDILLLLTWLFSCAGCLFSCAGRCERYLAELCVVWRYPDALAWQVNVQPEPDSSTGIDPLYQFIMHETACVSCLTTLDCDCLIAVMSFGALTLLVSLQEQRPSCKNWVIRCWCGYLSGARCRLFAYGPADAAAS